MILGQIEGDDARPPGAVSTEQPVEHALQARVRAVVSHRLAKVVHGLRIAPEPVQALGDADPCGGMPGIERDGLREGFDGARMVLDEGAKPADAA